MCASTQTTTFVSFILVALAIYGEAFQAVSNWNEVRSIAL